MKKSKLFFQFYKAIELAFAPGADKHSYRKCNCKKVKIFGYEDRRNIIKSTNQLCKFIESNYSHINIIKNIDSNHIEKFFLDKSKYCSKNTMNNYKYCIRKLEKMVQQYLYLKVKYIPVNINVHSEINSIRILEMNAQDINIILNECKKTKSKASLAIEVACLFGLRVSEICKLKGKDIDLEKLYLRVYEGKGKKTRSIKIDNLEKLELCIRIKHNVSDEERICALKENSVNAVIRRMLIKNKIIKYKVHKTGVHAIRKSYAKKSYNKHLKECCDKNDAWDKTAAELGHGKGRKSLKNVYVR